MNSPTAYDIQRNAISEAKKDASQAVSALYTAFKIVEVTSFGNPSLESEALKDLLNLTGPLYKLIQRARRRVSGFPLMVLTDYENETGKAST